MVYVSYYSLLITPIQKILAVLAHVREQTPYYSGIFKFPSVPQRFPLNDMVYDLRIDLVMFDGESLTNLVHLTFPLIIRPRMTSVSGNS